MFALIFRASSLRTLTRWLRTIGLTAVITGLPFSSVVAETQHTHEEEPPIHQDHTDHEDDESSDHEDKREHEHGHNEAHGHDDSINMTDNTAEQNNIRTAIARSGVINVTQPIYGKVVNDATQISHIRARFDGTIIKVNVNIGDHVKQGQALARIESNQSLHPYIVKAPFSGMITERHANPGELTQDQPLFTLFNDAVLWAEFKIFPANLRQVKAGQSVIISDEKFSISHIIPSQNGAPYQLARVRLDNHDHGWSAGIVIKAKVVSQSKVVPLRIENIALQTLEGNTVVFIKKDTAYHAQSVTLGLQDNLFSEVLTGITQGDEYVLENSYLIKADLEKAGAEHVH